MSIDISSASSETDKDQQHVTGADTGPSWCIFVKTVGKGFDDRRVNNDVVDNKKTTGLTSVEGSLSFHVKVSPEDRIDFLHDEIECITGVEASQQRLIYRGRLIGKSDVVPVSRTDTTNNDENNNSENDAVTCNEKADQCTLSDCKNEQPKEYKIKDIVGLCDGQTIHLVRKRGNRNTKSDANISDVVDGNSTPRSINNDNNASNSTSVESETVGGGSALLAALLGLGDDGASPATVLASPGSRPSASNNNNRNDVQATMASTNRPSPWRSPRATGNVNNDDATSTNRSPHPNRRPHYRLGTEDLEVADPGSMEPVRQGLMTLNTIMNSRPRPQNSNRNGGHRNVDVETREHTFRPLDVNREWFRGQWIDARDTVNQWLEATVVDILEPQDVLNDSVTLRDPASIPVHARYGSTENQQPRQRRVPNVDNDPAISANDLEGRRRLLLEECERGDPQEIILDAEIESDQIVARETNTSQSFRPRSTNNGVKLLLIHYNGWPHRWDEWIRSDSERLRPFRTRTRHPNSSSITSPTPQSVFNEAPRTNIVEDADEEEDRFAVLPELNIALSRVSELLEDLVRREEGSEDYNQHKGDGEDELEDLSTSNAETSGESNANQQRARVHLPWIARNTRRANNCHQDATRTISSEQNGTNLAETSTTHDHENALDESSQDAMRTISSDQSGSNLAETSTTHSQEIVTDESIPLLDGDPYSSNNSRQHNVRTLYSQGELRNLATLFDRLGRTLTDVAPHIASIAASLPAQGQTSSSTSEGENTPIVTDTSNSLDYDSPSAPLGGLLSLWSRERARRNNTDQEVDTTQPTTSTAPIDPDHIDFSSGIVNTTRGEVRSGPRSRTSNQDDVASLLGTYLAAASLGNVASSNEDNASGGASSLARLLQRGSSSGSGDNGIDIHIHAIVTAPGVSPGGMGIATLSSGNGSPTATLGGARNLFSPNRNNLRVDGGILRTGTSLSSNIVEPTDQEDNTDLFSELYSESPTPIDPNSSPVRAQSEADTISSANRNSDDDNNENNCSPTNQGHNLEQIESSRDTQMVTPTNNASRSSSRRRSGVFRLFRRRGSRNTNNDESSNIE